MSQIPPIRNSSSSYPLAYAGSWLFSAYDTNAGASTASSTSTLILARDKKTGYFVIGLYVESKKAWVLPTAFDHTMIQAFMSDNNRHLRLLGWTDRVERDELQIYLDLQFVDKDDYQHFMAAFRNQILCWSNSLLSRLDMANIFTDIPAKPGSSDLVTRIYFPEHAYQPPKYREYSLERADRDDMPKPHKKAMFAGRTESSEVSQHPSNQKPHVGAQAIDFPPYPSVASKALRDRAVR